MNKIQSGKRYLSLALLKDTIVGVHMISDDNRVAPEPPRQLYEVENMNLVCDCGFVFEKDSLVFADDGSVNWSCPVCGDCKEWYGLL